MSLKQQGKSREELGEGGRRAPRGVGRRILADSTSTHVPRRSCCAWVSQDDGSAMGV